MVYALKRYIHKNGMCTKTLYTQKWYVPKNVIYTKMVCAQKRYIHKDGMWAKTLYTQKWYMYKMVSAQTSWRTRHKIL